MTTEQSQSQNQNEEKISSTSESRYQNSLANAVHDSQQAYGLEKYGIPLSEVPLDRYDWQLMAIEESVDMNQYLTQEVRRLKQEVDYWTGYASKMRDIAHKSQALNSDLIKQNEDLKLQVSNLQRVYQLQRNIMKSDDVVSKKQAKELKAHGISD